MKIARSWVARVINLVLSDSSVKKASYIISPVLTITGTRRCKTRKNDRTVEMVLTIGKPNFANRQFIKLAKASGEPFPIKKIRFQ